MDFCAFVLLKRASSKRWPTTFHGFLESSSRRMERKISSDTTKDIMEISKQKGNLEQILLNKTFKTRKNAI